MHSTMLFSMDEYRERMRRAQTLMAENELDALLVTAPQNIIYMTGYRSNLFISNFRPYIALFPASGEPTLTLTHLELGVAEECAWMDDIRPWGPAMDTHLTRGLFSTDPLLATTALIKEKKLQGKRIGIEMGIGQRVGVNLEQMAQLRAALPDVTWKDSTPLLWNLRVRKSPKEVEYLRRASDITDKGYEAVLKAARVGATERELQGVMGKTFMELGGDYNGFIIVASGKDRYKMCNPYATDRKIQKGEMVIFDFGAVFNNYWSDLTRGFFMGDATPRQREFFEIARKATETTVKAIKPGVVIGSLDKIAEKFITDAGYREFMMHRTGHSIGLEIHEMPSIAATEQTVLEPGMTFAIEPGIYDYDIGAFRVEDIVTVTKTGVEYLSNCKRDLTIV